LVSRRVEEQVSTSLLIVIFDYGLIMEGFKKKIGFCFDFDDIMI
jgi:hypothetical protein